MSTTFQNDVQREDGLWLGHGSDFSSPSLLPSRPNATLSKEEVSAWIAGAQKLVGASRGIEPSSAKRLETLTSLLHSEEATVAFGGHFKSGKSTLINALLGREILPTSGLPETGAMCIMRSGSQDSARLSDANGSRSLQCTTDAIRHEISLTSATGSRRTETHDVERLELVLAEAPIGPRARWIDSPGINDTEEMTECAARAADEADVLLWVLGTRQFLSIAEVDFLYERVARRGPHSVALIVNAFLMGEDPAEWEEFLSEQMPVHSEKLRERVFDMGLDPDALPPVTIVSGRALGLQLGDWNESFGGRAVASLMNSLSSGEQPRVQFARWSRALTELSQVEEHFAAQLKSDVELLKEARAQSKAEQKVAAEAAKKDRAAFEKGVAEAIDAFQTDWEIRAFNCGERLANSIVPPNIWRDDTYSKYLNEVLVAANAEARESLGKALSLLAQKHAQTPPNATCTEVLTQLLGAPRVVVIVPNTAPPMTLDSFVNSFGARGQQATAFAKAKADADGTQWNVRHVTEYAATSPRANREGAIAAVLEHCVSLADHLPRVLAPESFSGGQVSVISGILDVSAADEPGPPTAYTSERSGVFSCRATSLRPNGACLVRLHFAETKATRSGERRFHVAANGQRVLSNYDIFARAGANKVVVAEFVAGADASGTLQLSFEAGSAGQPQVCAVQIIPQEEVKSRLSQLKVRVQRRRELWHDVVLLKEEAGKLVERF